MNQKEEKAINGLKLNQIKRVSNQSALSFSDRTPTRPSLTMEFNLLADFLISQEKDATQKANLIKSIQAIA